MASSGKVWLALIIGTLITVLFLATTGAVFAGDGPQIESTGAGDRQHPFAIEAHEILPPGALTSSPTIKTTTNATLFDEGFEGSFPGATWQVFHDSGTPDVDWGKSRHRKSAGSYSIWCAAQGSASPGPGGNIPINSKSWAIAGAFRLVRRILG